MWQDIFARSNFFDFIAIFPAIHKRKFSQIKTTANIFPVKIFFRGEIFFNLNSLHKNTLLTNRICLITNCLFRSETAYNEILLLRRVRTPYYCLIIRTCIARTHKKRKYYQCRVRDSLKIEKLIPSKKNQSVLMAKISFRKTQKIATSFPGLFPLKNKEWITKIAIISLLSSQTLFAWFLGFFLRALSNTDPWNEETNTCLHWKQFLFALHKNYWSETCSVII